MKPLDYVRARLETTISPIEYMKAVKADLKKYVLIDVRNSPKEVKTNYITGAIMIPEHELSSRLDEILKEKEIIVYC